MEKEEAERRDKGWVVMDCGQCERVYTRQIWCERGRRRKEMAKHYVEDRE